MEDIYFIMKSKKECPPGLCLEEGQYILAGDFVTNWLPIWVAKRMRWLSPPERLIEERLRER